MDGWRLATVMHQARCLDLGINVDEGIIPESPIEYPKYTQITPELKLHAESLLRLFSPLEPLTLHLRPTDAHKLRYFVADASAEGFGSVLQYADGSTERRDGLWMPSFAGGGSNLREATAQVNHLLSDVRAGRHDGCEVWCATDNAIWSYIWHKGMSTVKHLFTLVLDLKVACHHREVYLYPFHVSGNRMIACGIDGWSRGNHHASSGRIMDAVIRGRRIQPSRGYRTS